MTTVIYEGDGSWQKLLEEGRCVRCHSSTLVEVHGHVQCSVCKMYVHECCTGETASSLGVGGHEQKDKSDEDSDTDNQAYCQYGDL